MKVLVLGLDNSILDKGSALAKRAVEYGCLVEKYTIVVPAKENKVIKMSDNAIAYGIKTRNKVIGFFEIYHLTRALIKKEKFDIVTAQDQYYLGLIALRLAKKFKLGLEVQVHGFERYVGLRKLIAKYVIPRASAVRCVSQRLKRQLVGEFGIKEEGITVVPIYSGNREQGIGNREKKDGDKFVFLTIGRLVQVKNIEMQVRAMAEVVKKHPNVELWIVGEGPERGKLELGIARLGSARQGNLKLDEKIKMLGWQDDLGKFYSQADVFLLTSNYEGWGLAVIEAASYGLPIIMTDVGCAREVIKGFQHAATNGVHANDFNNVNGIIIPVGDQDKLEEAMVKLIEDDDLRERLGKSAQEAVKELPSQEETLKLYLKSWQKAAIKTL